jgi:hypothetical protein
MSAWASEAKSAEISPPKDGSSEDVGSLEGQKIRRCQRATREQDVLGPLAQVTAVDQRRDDARVNDQCH